MNYTLDWRIKYPFIAKIPGRPEKPAKWLRTQFGSDYMTLPSGKIIGVNSKEGIWMLGAWDYSGCTFRFCKEEHKTWFLLLWMTDDFSKNAIN